MFWNCKRNDDRMIKLAQVLERSGSLNRLIIYHYLIIHHSYSDIRSWLPLLLVLLLPPPPPQPLLLLLLLLQQLLLIIYLGRAIAQAVSRRLPTAAARVQTLVWSCGILWWTKVAQGQVFSENFGLPCQSTFHLLLHNHLHYHPQ
jgi:hypothetical protein